MTLLPTDEVRAAIHAALGEPGSLLWLERRVRASLDGPPHEIPARPRSLRAVAVGLAVAATFAGVLVAGLHLRSSHQPGAPSPPGVPAATASLGDWATSDFVWLSGPVLQPVQPTGVRLSGFQIDVIDWTGASRGHFQLPTGVGAGGAPFAAISADGHRALLADGRVIDQSGATVATIPVTASTAMLSTTNSRFADDDSGVCTAASARASSPDHGVTVDFVTLDGRVSTVATLGTEPVTAPVGAIPDSASVLSCSKGTDLAVVARYRDEASASAPTQPINNDVTITLWAVRLSTGKVLWQQPPQRIATGRNFAFGSANGALAVEFLWGTASQQEIDQVVHIPSGATVPGAVSAIQDTAGLSSDGSRILRRIIDPANNRTLLQLIDANSGSVLHTTTLPGSQGVFAVSQPGGSMFLLEMQKKLYVMDASGSTTPVETSVALTGESGSALMTLSGLQS